MDLTCRSFSISLHLPASVFDVCRKVAHRGRNGKTIRRLIRQWTKPSETALWSILSQDRPGLRFRKRTLGISQTLITGTGLASSYSGVLHYLRGRHHVSSRCGLRIDASNPRGFICRVYIGKRACSFEMPAPSRVEHCRNLPRGLDLRWMEE